MRGLAVCIGLAAAFGVFAVATAELSPASPDATRSPACAPGADFSASVCRAATADPDTPIATMPYAPEASSSLASAQTLARSEAPSASVILLARADAASTAAPGAARARRPVELPPVLAQAGAPIDAPSPAQTLRQTWAERTPARLPPTGLTTQALALSGALRQRIEAARYVGHRARMFLFVGGGQQVMAYNFTRAQSDIQIAGWSMERTVQLGEQQIGMAWENGRLRLAVAGVQRKVSQLGVSLKDNVAAISLTLNTGNFGESRSDRQYGR